MSTKYSILAGLSVFTALTFSSSAIQEEDNSGVAKLKAEQLVKAAQNYLAAADVRFESASTLLSAARKFRQSAYANEKERIANMKNAGQKELEAGSLCATACAGYDRAAYALRRAAGEYRKGKADEQADELVRLDLSTRVQATRACELSAESYEASAEAFSSINLSQMAASNEKAAKMRELLSTRLNSEPVSRPPDGSDPTSNNNS